MTTPAAPPPLTTTTKPVPTGPSKPPTHISPQALVADKAVLTGTHPITIAAHAIVHPFARIDSSHAPVDVGPAAVLWERSVVGAAGLTPSIPADSSAEAHELGQEREGAPRPTVIGRNASVGAHASVGVGARIGTHAVVETGARVGAGAEVGEYAKLSPLVEVGEGDVVERFTTVVVVAGRTLRRVNGAVRGNEMVRELQAVGHEKEMAVLRRVVKNGVAKWVH